jgi:hypothetical protein
MTCRHAAGDPNCSSSPAYKAARQQEYIAQTTPDADNYEILEAEKVGTHLVLKVRYPNCTRCAYEGSKVLVFLNTPIKNVLNWRRIDPHFRGPDHPTARQAPSPAARFPASDEGWKDALTYARWKAGERE